VHARDGVAEQSNCRHPVDERTNMSWTKPTFETLELASEVTAYRYSR
jgi:coenzyme PQQ precursor peptide PqqA